MKVRILHLHNTSNWGGNLAHVRLVMEGLSGDPSLELLLAAPPRESYLERFRGLGIRFLPWEVRSRIDAGAVLRLVRLVRAHGIDVVHSHMRRTDWVCAWASLLLRGRVFVTTVHGEVNRGPDFRRQGGLRSAVYGYLLAHHFDRVLAVSQDLARQLAEEEGVPWPRLLALTNGIPIPSAGIPTAEERQAAQRAFGLVPGSPTLVTIGRFGRRKGHAILLEAVSREGREGRPWQVLLVGDGDLEPECRAQAHQLGLEHQVRFLGFQADLLPTLRAAEVVVVPSYSEGIPRALLEGMAAGLAPVASDIGGVREALEAPLFGLTFAAGDAAALSVHLARLWESPELRRELGQKARQRVETRYRAESLVDEHRQLYRELLAQRAESRGDAS